MSDRRQLESILKIGLKTGVLLISVACLLWFSSRQPVMADLRWQSTGRPRSIDFNRDIRPILSGKCWVCHGPDAPNRKLRLRLDSAASARAELSRGRRAIVPGHPEQSELVRRITAENELLRMPPVDSG